MTLSLSCQFTRWWRWSSHPRVAEIWVFEVIRTVHTLSGLHILQFNVYVIALSACAERYRKTEGVREG